MSLGRILPRVVSTPRLNAKQVPFDDHHPYVIRISSSWQVIDLANRKEGHLTAAEEYLRSAVAQRYLLPTANLLTLSLTLDPGLNVDT